VDGDVSQGGVALAGVGTPVPVNSVVKTGAASVVLLELVYDGSIRVMPTKRDGSVDQQQPPDACATTPAKARPTGFLAAAPHGARLKLSRSKSAKRATELQVQTQTSTMRGTEFRVRMTTPPLAAPAPKCSKASSARQHRPENWRSAAHGQLVQ
jgi:hypothetical protein